MRFPIRTQRFCSIALLLCATHLPAADDDIAQRIRIPDARPRLEFTAAEIEGWRNDPARQDETRSVAAHADALLAALPTLPDAEGQWYFFYLCPTDGVPLAAESPALHRCGKCKAVFSDERTCAAYRTIQFGEADSAIHALALAYALTEKTNYAAAAVSLLVTTAGRHASLGLHDRWGRWGDRAPAGGRRYSQCLDEAVSLIGLAKSYDLIAAAPVWSASNRVAVEQQLLLQGALEIRARQEFALQDVEYPPPLEAFSMGLAPAARASRTFDPRGRAPVSPDVRRSNHQTWFNACYAAVAVAVGNTNLLADTISAPYGLLWQVRHSSTKEGLWYEGCMNYQFYALSAVVETLNSVRRAGLVLQDEPELQRLWQGPIELAYPNGDVPVINDSDPGTLWQYGGSYAWAAHYFGKPELSIVSDRPRALALLASRVSTNLTGLGLAILRGGTPADPVMVTLDYGPHGGQHGHPDKLAITVFARGREWIINPGRISYSAPEYYSWCHKTVAHNTVVLNGADQTPTQGECVEFTPSASGGVVVARSAGAYPGWQLERRLELNGPALRDTLTVSSASATGTVDWIVHARGLAGSTGDAPLEPGYEHLRDVRGIAGSTQMVFAASDGLSIELGDERGRTVFTGTGIGQKLDERVPFILRRAVLLKPGPVRFETTYRFE